MNDPLSTYFLDASKVVYVDYESGMDISSCGTLSTPCKTISMGVRVVKDFGKIFLLGNQYLNETVKVTKNVSISAFGNKSISIINGAKIQHTFEVKAPEGSKTARPKSNVIS